MNEIEHKKAIAAEINKGCEEARREMKRRGLGWCGGVNWWEVSVSDVDDGEPKEAANRLNR